MMQYTYFALQRRISGSMVAAKAGSLWTKVDMITIHKPSSSSLNSSNGALHLEQRWHATSSPTRRELCLMDAGIVMLAGTGWGAWGSAEACWRFGCSVATNGNSEPMVPIEIPIFLWRVLTPVGVAVAAAAAATASAALIWRWDTTVWASYTADGWRTQVANETSDAAVAALGSCCDSSDRIY